MKENKKKFIEKHIKSIYLFITSNLLLENKHNKMIMRVVCQLMLAEHTKGTRSLTVPTTK